MGVGQGQGFNELSPEVLVVMSFQKIWKNTSCYLHVRWPSRPGDEMTKIYRSFQSIEPTIPSCLYQLEWPGGCAGCCSIFLLTSLVRCWFWCNDKDLKCVLHDLPHSRRGHCISLSLILLINHLHHLSVAETVVLGKAIQAWHQIRMHPQYPTHFMFLSFFLSFFFMFCFVESFS